MNNKIKDYVFIFYILFLPFVLLLLTLRMNSVGVFNDVMYYYIILFASIVMVITFFWSLLYTIDDILNSDESMVFKNMKLALVLICSVLYVAIHYIVTYYHKYRFLSLLVLLINLITLVYFVNTFDNYNSKLEAINTRNGMSFIERYDYYFDNKNFVINVDVAFNCNENAGDYILSCEDNRKDSFIGAYKYMLDDHSTSDLSDIYKYHIDQTISYITDANYEYTMDKQDNVDIIKYNNMNVYITYKDYDLNHDNHDDLRLIIINEISDDNIDNFNKLIDSIKLNK